MWNKLSKIWYTCRVHIKPTSVEVRFQNVTVEASIFLGGRSMPSVGNAYLNFIEVCICFIPAQVS